MALYSIVLWDIGGTLFDYAMPMERFLHRCLQQAGINISTLDPNNLAQADEFRREHMNLWRTAEEESAGYLDIAKLLLSGSGASSDQVKGVAAALSHYYDLYTPVLGIRSLLEELKEYGIIQGVVSDWPPSLRSFLEHHGFDHYFTVIVSSGEVGAIKPASALFKRALSELEAEPSECVYVGDHLDKDIKAARELGMYTVHFNPRLNEANADAYDTTGLQGVLLPLLHLPVDT